MLSSSLKFQKLSTTYRVALKPSRTYSVTKAIREPWDLGRFAKTVLFFNPPPSFTQIINRIFKSSSETSSIAVMEAPKRSVVLSDSILFLGHETEIGSFVLKEMLTRGTNIYLLDPKTSSSSTISEGQTRQNIQFLKLEEESISAELLKSASSIVICGSDNSLWHKFDKAVYMPEKGISDVVWGPLDDVVMGGCSQSDLTIQNRRSEESDFAAIFSGNITSANNGGFASVRTKNFEPTLSLLGYDGIKLKVKGDGQRYKFMLRTTTQWDSVSFCKSFDTVEGWQEIKLDFKEFIPVFRARTVVPPPPLEVENINSLQIMLSKFEYDGELNPSIRMGRFELPIEHIKAYTDEANLPRLVLIDGGEAAQTAASKLGGKSVSIEVDKSQELAMKDSTLVKFCVESILNKDLKEGKYKEKSRSVLTDDSTSFEELLNNFEF